MEESVVLDERAQRIAALEAEVALLRDIIRTQDLINVTSRDPRDVMNLVAERAQRLTRASAALVFLVDGDDVVLHSATGAAAGRCGLRVPIATSLVGHCVRTGEVGYCNDTWTDDRVDGETCRAFGIRSMIITPLVNMGYCEGTVVVVSGQPAAFTGTDVHTQQAMAGFIATSLRNARISPMTVRAAQHDPLTGLLNRASLLDYLDQAIRSGDWAVRDLAVLFIDLDDFRSVNERFGTSVGDELLIVVSQRLRRCVRPNDLVARLGGDEFVVLADIEHDKHMQSLADRISASLAHPARIGDAEIPILGSIGTARPARGDGAADLLARADASMYCTRAAKRPG